MAVVKLAISKPGTNIDVSHKRATLIKKAEIPKVRIEIGKAINCKMGRMKVFTMPITMAATKAAAYPERIKPGTRYSTTRRAITLIPKRTISFIN